MISSQNERYVTADDTHVNVGLAKSQVQTMQRVGGVQEDGQQQRDDQEHREVDRGVEHWPEPKGDQIPAWKLSNTGLELFSSKLTHGHNKTDDPDNIHNLP